MRVKSVLVPTATAVLAAVATQTIGAGTASAAAGGHLVVLDTRTGRVIETDATPEPRVVMLDIRTGRVLMPGYEFFLAQPTPLPAANTGPASYPADGSEFRLNK